MVIAIRASVRKKAGNRSPDILPDADIDAAIQASDVIVQSALNKFDWTVDDPGYYAVREISELFAAADVLSRFQDQQDKSKEEFERAQYLLKLLQDNFDASTGGEEPGHIITIVSPEYNTYPLNPSAVYRRPYGKGEAVDDLVSLRSATTE
jgi:hypothetical protein